jgi:hypothetical protein
MHNESLALTNSPNAPRRQGRIDGVDLLRGLANRVVSSQGFLGYEGTASIHRLDRTVGKLGAGKYLAPCFDRSYRLTWLSIFGVCFLVQTICTGIATAQTTKIGMIPASRSRPCNITARAIAGKIPPCPQIDGVIAMAISPELNTAWTRMGFMLRESFQPR